MTLSEQLRRYIRASGRSAYRISKDSGVDHSIIVRFLSGQRGLRQETFDRLGEYFGLKLVKARKG